MTTLDSSPEEILLNPPTPFDGNRKKTKTFILDCYIYLEINEAIYDTDDDKIIFVLSHMTEKMQLWKKLYIDAHTHETTGDINFPTYSDFIGKLKEEFEQSKEEALTEFYLLKQGNLTAEELVPKFRFLATEAGLGFQTYSDHIHMIRLFQKALNPQLLRQIFLASGELPKTIDGWFRRAIQIERVLAIISKGPRRQEKNKTRNRSWNFSKPTAKDPNTIDINTMSQQERTDLMKKGACFRCKKRGHRARDCSPEEK